jgi:hypothetical protein
VLITPESYKGNPYVKNIQWNFEHFLHCRLSIPAPGFGVAVRKFFGNLHRAMVLSAVYISMASKNDFSFKASGFPLVLTPLQRSGPKGAPVGL